MDSSNPRELKRTAVKSPTKDDESKKSRLEESPNEAIPGPSHAEFEPNSPHLSIGQEIEDIIKCLPTRPDTPTPMKSLMSYDFNRLYTDCPVRFLETPPLEEVLGTEESRQYVGTEQSQIPQEPMMEDTTNFQPENQEQEPYYEWWKPEPQYPTEAFATMAQEPNSDNNNRTNEWALANFIQPEWGIPVPQTQWQLRESTPMIEDSKSEVDSSLDEQSIDVGVDESERDSNKAQIGDSPEIRVEDFSNSINITQEGEPQEIWSEEHDESIYIITQEGEQPEIRLNMDENKAKEDKNEVENIPQERVLPEIRVTMHEDDKVEEETEESIFIVKEEGKPPVIKLSMDEDDK